MKIFALKYKNTYNLFTHDIHDLDVYKNNKYITKIVELEIEKNENGRYWLFEGKDEFFVSDLELDIKCKAKNKEGNFFKVDLKEIYE